MSKLFWIVITGHQYHYEVMTWTVHITDPFFGETRLINQLKGQVVQSFYGFFVKSQDGVWHK